MARRIAGSKVNWAALLERVPEDQKGLFTQFKARSDNYLRRVLANPETPPKLDWAALKKQVPVAGLVDTFQKNYEALKIAYPTENVSGQIDEQEKKLSAYLQQLGKETNDNVAQLKAEIQTLESLVPYSEMTIEELYIAHPEKAIDTFNKPTYWPHNAEEQLDYVPKDAPPPEKH